MKELSPNTWTVIIIVIILMVFSIGLVGRNEYEAKHTPIILNPGYCPECEMPQYQHRVHILKRSNIKVA